MPGYISKRINKLENKTKGKEYIISSVFGLPKKASKAPKIKEEGFERSSSGGQKKGSNSKKLSSLVDSDESLNSKPRASRAEKRPVS